MKLENQVTSPEISNKLKDLGVTTPGIFLRDYRGSKADEIEESTEPGYFIDGVNCYTVAELGEMLPEIDGLMMFQDRAGDSHRVWYANMEDEEYPFDFDNAQIANTEADARGKMLIYLLENKLINSEIETLKKGK